MNARIALRINLNTNVAMIVGFVGVNVQREKIAGFSHCLWNANLLHSNITQAILAMFVGIAGAGACVAAIACDVI